MLVKPIFSKAFMVLSERFMSVNLTGSVPVCGRDSDVSEGRSEEGLGREMEASCSSADSSSSSLAVLSVAASARSCAFTASSLSASASATTSWTFSADSSCCTTSFDFFCFLRAFSAGAPGAVGFKSSWWSLAGDTAGACSGKVGASFELPCFLLRFFEIKSPDMAAC